MCFTPLYTYFSRARGISHAFTVLTAAFGNAPINNKTAHPRAKNITVATPATLFFAAASAMADRIDPSTSTWRMYRFTPAATSSRQRDLLRLTSIVEARARRRCLTFDANVIDPRLRFCFRWPRECSLAIRKLRAVGTSRGFKMCRIVRVARWSRNSKLSRFLRFEKVSRFLGYRGL